MAKFRFSTLVREINAINKLASMASPSNKEVSKVKSVEKQQRVSVYHEKIGTVVIPGESIDLPSDPRINVPNGSLEINGVVTSTSNKGVTIEKFGCNGVILLPVRGGKGNYITSDFYRTPHLTQDVIGTVTNIRGSDKLKLAEICLNIDISDVFRESLPSIEHLLTLLQARDQERTQEYEKKRKNPNTGFLLALFGLSLFYRGKIGLGILFWLTFGGWGIWYVVELIVVMKKINEYNEELYERIRKGFI